MAFGVDDRLQARADAVDPARGQGRRRPHPSDHAGFLPILDAMPIIGLSLLHLLFFS